MSKDNKVVRFKHGLTIGYSAAEDDEAFLKDCFVDTEHYQMMIGEDSPKCIILGRTGAGKSALIYHIKDQCSNVVEIEPEALALNYISNSDIITFYSSIGVNLDIFYQLLWRHVFCVQIIKQHFKLESPSDMQRFKNWLTESFGNNLARKAAVEYLEKWNSKFWEETEERIKEITSSLEDQLSAGIDLASLGIPIGANHKVLAKEKVTKDIVVKAQKIVNNIQIRQLGEVVQLLADELYNSTKIKYYIVIDRLDDRWVDDEIRYNLIRGLIEAVKTLKKIRNVKIIISMRDDLLQGVYRRTHNTGFQPEKYEDLNLRIKWNAETLSSVVEKRLNVTLKHMYTNKEIKIHDVFPEEISNKKFLDYILQRTLFRPRDVIAFINDILDAAGGNPVITQKIVLDAEAKYSEGRLEAILYEWHGEYPNLESVVQLLANTPSRFALDYVSKEDIDNFSLDFFDNDDRHSDALKNNVNKYYNGKIQFEVLRQEVFRILYNVGMIGVKPSAYNKTMYCYNDAPVISKTLLDENSSITVHPMLWRALGIHKKRTR